MFRGRHIGFVSLVVLSVAFASAAPTPLIQGAAAHGASIRMVAPTGLRMIGSAVLNGGLDALSQADTPAAQRVLRNGGLHTRAGLHGLTVAVSIDVEPADSASVAAQVVRSGDLVREDGRLVEGYVPLSSLTTLAALPGVLSVAPIRSAMIDGFVSPGVTLLGADAWQADGLTGAGIKVGVIDTGFSGLAPLLGTALPANSVFRCYPAVGSFTTDVTDCAGTGGSDSAGHGTAVAETVSGTAPGAQLYISNVAGAGSWADMLDTVNWMTAQGVRIINASWGDGVFEGPGDGTSPFTNSSYLLIDAAVRGGALWVNAAGNEATGGWSGPLVDANDDSWVEFSGTDDENTLPLVAGQSVSIALRWTGSWGGSAADYAVGIYSLAGEQPLAWSGDYHLTSLAVPLVAIPNFRVPTTGTYRIAVKHLTSSVGAPRATLLVQGLEGTQGLEYSDPAGTLTSPADSANPGMVTVGAVGVAAPGTVEPFSSRGPTTDGRVKPDLVAPDCVPTSQYQRFCGTSEAAPFVSGAAALILQADPRLTPVQLAASLRAHSTPLGAPVPNDTFGYGRLTLGAVPHAPAGLAFTTQPQGGTVGTPLVVQPAVRIVDSGGTTVTAGTGSTLPVTLAVSGGTGSGTLTCTGGLTVAAVAGVASFSGCSISPEGQGYVLTASTPALPATQSVPISVWPAGIAPATLTLASSLTVLTWGQGTTLSVHLSSVLPGAMLAGRAVVPEVSVDGTTWTALSPLTTDGTGAASLVYRPATNLWYRVSYTGSADLAGAVSGTVRVAVRQIALLRPDTGSRTTTLPIGRRVTFTTTVRPARPELPAPTATYRVYRLVGRSWSLYRVIKVTASATGVATLVWTFGARGSWAVTSMANPTPYNANSVWYARQRYDVF